MSTISQVIFNIDTKLKNQAMKKAKLQGVPFSSVLKMVVRAFVQGELNVGLTEELNWKARRQFDRAEKDLKKGKNISPGFTTVAQARAYLDN